jgi:hypothetical protein
VEGMIIGLENDDLGQLVKATNKEKPDKADLERLRAHLVKYPEAAEKLGNLTRHIEMGIISRSFRNSRAVEMGIAAHMGNMLREFKYSDSSLLERLLIDHIVVCWLRHQLAESRYQQATAEGVTFEAGIYWERKLSATQRRYLRAIEALARVRKLMERTLSPLTAIQVNVNK